MNSEPQPFVHKIVMLIRMTAASENVCPLFSKISTKTIIK